VFLALVGVRLGRLAAIVRDGRLDLIASGLAIAGCGCCYFA